MSHMKAQYLGDEQVELTHGLSGNKILTDLPPDNGGQGRTFSPTDLFASSLCSCILTIMAKMAERDGEDFKGAEIEFEKVMMANPRRVSKIFGIITFPSHFTDEKKKKYLSAIKACPVHHSLHPDILVDFQVK